MLHNLELRQIYLFFGSLALLSITALVFMVGKPTYQHFQQITADLVLLQQSVKSHSPIATADLEKQIGELSTSLSAVHDNIPHRQFESHIISRLQKGAWLNNINLLSIEPLSAIQEQPFEEFTFQIRVTGNYLDIDTWLTSLSSDLNFVAFNEIDLTTKVTDSSEPSGPMLTASVKLSAFRLAKGT